MSAERAYGRTSADRARLPVAPEWTTRAGIALAVFLGFIALGRVSASPSAAGEATAPVAIAGSPRDALTPARLAGAPPLEHLLARAKPRAPAARARQAPQRSPAPVAASPAPAASVGGEAVVQAAPEPERAAPVARTPSVSPAPAARAPSQVHGSSGGSFDSSG